VGVVPNAGRNQTSISTPLGQACFCRWTARINPTRPAKQIAGTVDTQQESGGHFFAHGMQKI